MSRTCRARRRDRGRAERRVDREGELHVAHARGACEYTALQLLELRQVAQERALAEAAVALQLAQLQTTRGLRFEHRGVSLREGWRRRNTGVAAEGARSYAWLTALATGFE
jgi:hypothetical protein